ncbi:MAG TPA: hypothetical protein VIH08_09585 [Blastococcus sp.]
MSPSSLAAAQDADRDRFCKQILGYAALVAGPFLARLVFVVPGWL